MPLGEHATTHRMREVAPRTSATLTLVIPTINEVVSDGQVVPSSNRVAIKHTTIEVPGTRFDIYSSTQAEERHVVEWESAETETPSPRPKDPRREAQAEQLAIFFRGAAKPFKK